jgi:hypothetical protein
VLFERHGPVFSEGTQKVTGRISDAGPIRIELLDQLLVSPHVGGFKCLSEILALGANRPTEMLIDGREEAE